MDNLTDALMPDQGTAHRPLPFAGGRRPATTMEGGDAPDALVAEHGFSVLVDVSKDGTRHTVLFDTGTSPDGVAENMRRLHVDLSGIEVIICSHGHFDHTTGLDGIDLTNMDPFVGGEQALILGVHESGDEALRAVAVADHGGDLSEGVVDGLADVVARVVHGRNSRRG